MLLRSLEELQEILLDHTTVSEESTSLYMTRGPSFLAFWTTQIAVYSDAVNEADARAEFAYATAYLANRQNLTEGRRPPTKEDAERAAAIDPTVVQHKALAARYRVNLDFCKRAFDTVSKGSTLVQALAAKQTVELRTLRLMSPHGEPS